MIVCVAGGRDYYLTLEGALWLHQRLMDLKAEEVINGGARGIDSCADFLSYLWGVKRVVFKAKWDELGKAAGPERNERMADYADAVITFAGGNGTKNMIRQAKEKGKRVISTVDPIHVTKEYAQSIYFDKAGLNKLKELSL